MLPIRPLGIALVSMTGVLALSQPPHSATVAQGKTAADTVRALAEEYEAALASMDAEKSLSFLIRGSDRLGITDSSVTRVSYDSMAVLQRNRKNRYDSLPGGHTLDVSMAGPNAATVVSTWWERPYPKNGGRRHGHLTGRTLYFWTRTPGGWKIFDVHEHSTRLSRTEVVQYISGADTVSSLLTVPWAAGAGPWPAVLVVPASTGLDRRIQASSERLAEQGYVTLALDFYRGKVGASHAEGEVLAAAVPRGRKDTDVAAAMMYLRSRPEVQLDRIGALGWCAGGSTAFKLALRDSAIKAVSVHYGNVTSDTARLKPLRAAVQGLFGGKDPTIAIDSITAFQHALQQLGKSVTIKIYPEAGHAFEFEGPHGTASTGFRPDDTADAWKQTVDFFNANLKAPDAPRSHSAPSNVAAVLRADSTYQAALMSADTTTLKKLLAPGWTMFHSQGYSQTRESFLDQFRREQRAFMNFRRDSVQVEMFGNAAVLTARTTREETVNGYHQNGTVHSLFVYTLQDGIWKIAMTQQTTVRSAPAVK